GTELSNATRMIEQLNLAAVNARQKVLVQLRFRPRRRFVLNSQLAELLARPFARIPVAGDRRNAVAVEQISKFRDNTFGRERWPNLAQRVNDRDLTLLVTDRQREAVGRAAARVHKGRVGDIGHRSALANAKHNASLDRLAADIALDVGSEICKILSRSGSVIAFQRAIDNALRQRRVELAARTMRHEDERITARAVVTLVRLVQHASFRVRRACNDQRTTSRRKTGAHRIQNFSVSVGGKFVAVPEGCLVSDDGNIGRTAQSP